MSIFGAILKTTFDVVTLPVDVAKDVVTLGGAVTDQRSAVAEKCRRLSSDAEEIREELGKL